MYHMTNATIPTAMANLAGRKRTAAAMMSKSVEAGRGANSLSSSAWLWPVQALGLSQAHSVDLLPRVSPAATDGSGRGRKRRRLELGDALLRGRAPARRGNGSESRHFGDGATSLGQSAHTNGAPATTRLEPVNPGDGQASDGRTGGQSRATASTVSPDSSVLSVSSETANLRWRRRGLSTASAAMLCGPYRQRAAGAAVDSTARAGYQ